MKERIEYIKELRRKILIICIPSFIILVFVFLQSQTIINWLINYYELTVYNFSPSESISISLTLAFFSALLFFIPALIYQLLSFSKELLNIKYTKGFLIKSSFGIILGIMGFILGSTFITKIVLEGLAVYNIGIPMWSITSVLKLALIFGLTIGLSFQMIWFIPVIINIRLIKKKDLNKARPFIIVGSLIISALITPPDIISYIIMAIPIYFSYEIGLIFSKEKGGIK